MRSFKSKIESRYSIELIRDMIAIGEIKKNYDDIKVKRKEQKRNLNFAKAKF